MRYDRKTVREVLATLIRAGRRDLSRQFLTAAQAPRELHLYDFDGTMFKSPPPPASYKGVFKEYFWKIESLIPPCVPERPDASWWVPSVVSAARKSISRSDVYAVCCTARRKPFVKRVHQLLRQAGLKFPDVRFKLQGGNTVVFKTGVMAELHAKYQFEAVHVWEDHNMGAYKQFVEQKLGIPCTVHPQADETRPPEC